MVELASSDVAPARQRELAQGLPISGSLRAANWALVKARVAGELQGLTLREGDAVKAGQVVGRIDPTDYQARLRQAREQADAARAQIDIAQRQWDNNKALVDQGFISRTALETSQSNLASAQANHKAALAAVDMAAKTMDDTLLRAPISGVVAQRIAQPGERVAVDARVLEIVDLSRMELEATVGAADSLDVKIGQSAVLRVEGSAQPIQARVVRINPTAQSGSRQVLVYLALQNASGLRQGLFAQGSLGLSAAPVLSVPLSSVRTDKPQPYVQVVEGNKVAHRQVALGVRGEARGETAGPGSASGGEPMVQVLTGVTEGALVLAGHVGALREGSEVKFTRAQPEPAQAAAKAPAAQASAPK
jgi:RND family efflux transporter MFP subunit